MEVMTEEEREISNLKFGIEKSMRYHQRRRAFLETVHRLLMFSVIVVGSTAALVIVPSEKWLGVAAALIAAFDLVYAPGMRARDHMILNQRFTVLMADVFRAQSIDAGRIAEWKAQRILIEADEPPIYWALDKDCYNEICFALGKATPANLYKLSTRERLFMNFFRFEHATPVAQ
jgi:hypothetical protein